MEYADQIDPIREREIEQEKIFEAVTDRNATHPLQIAQTIENRLSTTRVGRRIGKAIIDSRQKSVCDVETGVLGIPDPLLDEIAFCGFAFNNPSHQAVLRDLRDSNCFSASRRMSSQS